MTIEIQNQVYIKIEVVNEWIRCGAMENKTNKKGEFSSDAGKLINYLMTSQYRGGSTTELVQQWKKIDIRYMF